MQLLGSSFILINQKPHKKTFSRNQSHKLSHFDPIKSQFTIQCKDKEK